MNESLNLDLGNVSFASCPSKTKRRRFKTGSSSWRLRRAAGLTGSRIGRVRAVVGCCVVETTLTFVPERFLKREDYRREYFCESVSELEQYEKPGHQANRKATYEAQRIKKVRLRKSAYTIVGLHGRRVRWITITVRENVKDKKQFLYMVENLRKELSKNGFTLKYTGMMERQDGKRRADKIGRGAWHLHALAYLLEDDWDFKSIQKIAVRRGMNIDMQELDKRARTSRMCASYMLKIDAAVKAAYAAKMETGEDYIYTLTSKGCDLPRKKVIYDKYEALRFIEGYGFRQMSHDHKDGSLFHYYLLQSEAFGRDIYDSC